MSALGENTANSGQTANLAAAGGATSPAAATAPNQPTNNNLSARQRREAGRPCKIMNFDDAKPKVTRHDLPGGDAVTLKDHNLPPVKPSVESGTTAPPLDNSVHPQTTEERIRQVFGPDTTVQFLDAKDKRCEALMTQVWGSHPNRPDRVAAVICGAQSNNLCVLFVYNKQSADEFLKSNPGLAGTLVTSVADWHFIWMRFTDQYPASVTSVQMEFVASGSVFVPSLPTLSAPPSIVTTKFADVRWPAALEVIFFETLAVAEYGPYYRIISPKKKELNHALYARIISRAAGLVFDADTQTFYRLKPKEEGYEPMTTPGVIALVTKCLTNSAALDPIGFPIHELRLPRIKLLVEHIKSVTSITRTNARESLIEYVRARLCLNPGSGLTVQDIHDDYLAYARRQNITLYPVGKFHMELPRVMLELFTVTRTNNLMRLLPGSTRMTARRGFHGIGFKTDGTDGGDGRDGADGVVENPN